MKKFLCYLLILLSTGSVALSTVVDVEVLNLSPPKYAEFKKLPLSVQNLMLQEAKFRKKAKEIRRKKEEKTKFQILSLTFSNRHDPRCDDDDSGNDSRSCVPRCTWRRSDGSCISHGADFCSKNASCSPNCTWRISDGSCNSYDEDFCGEDAVCSPNCTWRGSDGSCNSYDSDVCF